MKRVRHGAAASHLALHLTGFGFCAFLLAQIVRAGAVVSFVVWFVGAAVLHDLVLLPAYSLLDHVLRRARGSLRIERGERPSGINHLRVPAVISGVLLLVYFPLILRLSERRYRLASGHPIAGYAGRWVAITVGLFLVSGLLYGLRAWRARR